MIKLYCALVHPHLLYGLITWGQTFLCYLTKLSTLQNKAIKIFWCSTYKFHLTPYFKQFGVLKAPNLRNHETAGFVHLHFRKKLSPQLSNIFTQTRKTSPRPSKSICPSNNLFLYIPKFWKARLLKSIKYKDIKVWNAIPANIQTKTQRFFKLNLRYIFWVTTINDSVSLRFVTSRCSRFSKLVNSNYLISRVLLNLKTEISSGGYASCMWVYVRLDYN